MLAWHVWGFGFDFQYRKGIIFRKPLFPKRYYSHCKFIFRKMGRRAEKLFLKTPFFLLLYLGWLIRNSRPEPSACMARWCPVISKWMHMPKHPWFLNIGCLSPETLHQYSVWERAGLVMKAQTSYALKRSGSFEISGVCLSTYLSCLELFRVA